MPDKLTEHSSWDNRPRDAMSREDIYDVIANAKTCVIVRNRQDGHPIGTVVGSGVIDGEIYTSTNLFRSAFRSIQRDPRCSAVFDIPEVASVTVIGTAEIVDDMTLVERLFRQKAPSMWLVRDGKLTEQEYVDLAFTPNRRLFHIVPEKFVTSDMRTLV